MTSINAQLVGTETGGTVLLENDSGVLLETGDSLNDEAVIPNHTGNTTCHRSGEKCLPGELVKDQYSKNLVKKKYADSSQEFTRKYRSSQRGGSKSPEHGDTFITTPVTIDDL